MEMEIVKVVKINNLENWKKCNLSVTNDSVLLLFTFSLFGVGC